MVQLKKTSLPVFHGNGLGTSTAGWVVKGSEHVAVRQLGTSWVAVGISSPTRESFHVSDDMHMAFVHVVWSVGT